MYVVFMFTFYMPPFLCVIFSSLYCLHFIYCTLLTVSLRETHYQSSICPVDITELTTKLPLTLTFSSFGGNI